MYLFVYGSLQEGECNYDQVSRWVRSVTPARGPGRLYLRPDGYPALCLEPALWLAEGSRDYAADAARCGSTPTAKEGTVPGQLLELEHPEQALSLLDWFEGYEPGRPSEYWRVLVALASGPAWTYVCRPEQVQGWPTLTRWPPPHAATPEPYRGSLQS